MCRTFGALFRHDLFANIEFETKSFDEVADL
jgi:hypothetical protein